MLSATPMGAPADPVAVDDPSATPVNELPVEVFNFPPVFFADSTASLVDETALEYFDPDNDASEIVFQLDSLIGNGTFAVTGQGELGIGDTFTQEDIFSERLTFTPHENAIGSDVVQLSVSDGSGIETDFTFEVIVGNTIQQGADTNILGTDIHIISADPDFYRLDFAPTQGTLYLDTTGLGDFVELVVTDNFTQADVDAGRVNYVHDGLNQDPDVFVVLVTETSEFEASEEIELLIVDPPNLDLDADDSSGASGNDFDQTYVIGSPFVSVTDSDVIISDLFNNNKFETLSVDLSGFADGTDEEIRVADQKFQYGNPANVVTTLGSSNIEIMFDGNSFTIANVSGSISQTEIVALIETFEYRNISAAATTGTRLFDFRVENNQGSTSLGALGSVDVTINLSPVASQVTLRSSFEDTVRVITQDDLLVNANDPNGDSLSAVSLTVTSGNGFIIDNEDGTFDYNPDLDDDSDVSFSYTITDGTNNIAASATLDITSVNDAPVAGNDTFNTNENVALEGNLLDNDSDVDGDRLTASLSLSGGPSNGTFILNADGSFTYTPDTNYVGTESFFYRVSDGGFSAPLGSVTINVNSVPTTSHVTLASITEDSGDRRIGQQRLLQNANDLDGDSLTATGLRITSGNGRLFDNRDGSWNYTPDENDDTEVSFEYTITDGIGSVVGTATLDITPVNDAPTAPPVTLSQILEDSSGARTINPSRFLAEASDIEGDALTLTSLTINTGQGILGQNANGRYTYTPCLLYTSPSPRDQRGSRMPSSA